MKLASKNRLMDVLVPIVDERNSASKEVVKQQNKATNQQMIILLHETNIERQNYLAKLLR